MGACGPGRGRARASLWGNHRSSSEGRISGRKRRKREDDLEGQEDWEDVKEVVCARILAPSLVRHLAFLQNETPLLRALQQSAVFRRAVFRRAVFSCIAFRSAVFHRTVFCGAAFSFVLVK